MNELEKESHLTSDSEKVMKSVNVAVNSDNRKDTLSLISDIEKNQSAVSTETLNEALLSACNKGNKFLVQSLLVNNAEVNCRDEKQNTPLMLCAMNGFCDIAEILIEGGADVNCFNDHGNSALILSVTNFGSTDMVQFLLDQQDIDISHENNESHSCLSRAVELLDFKIIQIILKNFLPKYSYEGEQNSKHKMMLSHAQDAAKSLGILKIFHFLMKEITENKPALLTAVSQSDLESVNFLLKFVLSKSASKNRLYNSFIMQVMNCYEGRNTDLNENDFEIVTKLIESEKLVTSEMISYNDEDVLAKAIIIGDYRLLDLLCPFIIKDSQNAKEFLRAIFFNGLLTACKKCSRECLSILLKYKSDLVPQFENCADIIEDDIDEFVELEEALKLILEKGQAECFNLILNEFPLEVASLICSTQSHLLHISAVAGNEEIIVKLLDLGADVNRLYHDKTPLMYCRKPEIANILLKRGADIHYKVQLSELTVILNLFSEDYFRNVENIYVRIHCSDEYLNIRKTSDQVIEMKKDLISLFIQHGSDIEAKDSKGQNALMFASKLEGFEKILELLLISGADPNKCNKEGKSALHFAVSENHLKNVMTLLNNAADVNKKCYHGNTCLHLSAKNQNVEIFKVLLKHGADIEAKNSKGQTVLMFSSESAGFDTFLELILQSGADPNACNEEGETALYFAVSGNHLRNVETLLNYDADVNQKCHFGLSCLHLSARSQDIEMVTVLLKHGADVSLEDLRGNTPLLVAVGLDLSDSCILKCLLDAGSDVNHLNKEGYSALMIAANKGSLESIKLLCERGADIKSRNMKDSKNVVDILVEKSTSHSVFSKTNFIICLEYVLENGGVAANVKTENVFQLIYEGQFTLIQKLIFAGLSPSECPVNKSDIYARDCLTISPFCYALLSNKEDLAKYFKDITFLTSLDVFDRMREKSLQFYLARKKYFNCLKFFDEFYSQPLSLEKLCLISITSTLGNGIERENKVKELSFLPPLLIRKILYQTESVLNRAYFDDDSKESSSIYSYDGPNLIDDVDNYSDYRNTPYSGSDDSYGLDVYDS